MPDRTKVDSKDTEGEQKVVYVVSPSPSANREAQMEYNRAFKDAIQSGALLKQKLQAVMEEQDVWSDEKQKRYEGILEEVMQKELSLKKGGIKLSQARKVALEIRDLRFEFRGLIAEKNSMDSNTAEGQADNARFSYLAYACLVNEEGQKVFNNFDHYKDNENEPFVIDSARELAQLLYGLDPDYENNLSENQFLQDYEFVDKDLRWIDKKGRFTDIDGNLIDEEGRYINEKGEFIDKKGNKVTKEGELTEEGFSPFLDDKGKPVVKLETEDSEGDEETEEAEAVEAEAVSEEPKKTTTKGRSRKKPATKAKAKVAE
tara:strand:- start:5218 stop:6168 length:951 start_codon:yes stop_codon:yes gene_type:complete